jgi:hypothetical protein
MQENNHKCEGHIVKHILKIEGEKFTVAQSPMATKFLAGPPNHHVSRAHVANKIKK